MPDPDAPQPAETEEPDTGEPDLEPATEHTGARRAAPADTSADVPDGPARLRHALLHVGRSQVLVAVVLCLVTVGLMIQVRARNNDQTYASARRADLVQLVDGLGTESRRLEGEISELERTRRELQSGTDSQRTARDEAQRRVEVLSVLAGTAPAEGPGVRITITDTESKVGPGVLLDALEEMRDAGAEVIEINDSVRVVGASWISGAPGALVVDGQPVRSPIVIEVIGEPHALEEAARFRGGLVSEVTSHQIGARVEVQRSDRLAVASLHVPKKQQYARPAG